MIWLGYRLVAGAGRRALATLLLTAAVVAAGTALLLLALSVAPAVQSRVDRTAWIGAVGLGTPPGGVPVTWVSSMTDDFGTQQITVVDVAGAGPGAPVPRGLQALPAPGQVFVSDALRTLMARAAPLRSRYGTVAGELPARLIAGPQALVALRGQTVATGSLAGTAVTAFPTSGESFDLTGPVRLLLFFGAVAMLAPLVLLVSMATRLTAATRDQRLAALRLAGATPRQTAQLTLVESVLVATVGLVFGTVMFWVLRPVAAQIGYEGQPWYAGDLAPGPIEWAVALIGVPLVTILASGLTLARVARTPLAVARRSSAQNSAWWRLIPLALALPLIRFVLLSKGFTSGGQGRAVAVAFAVLLGALLLAAPVLIRMLGLLLARSARPSRLLAGRRLADDPRAGGRPSSIAAIVVLAVTMFATAVPAAAESLSTTTAVGQQDGTAMAAIPYASQAQSSALAQQVRAIGGVTATVLVHSGVVQYRGSAIIAWIGDCRQIVRASRLNTIACGRSPLLASTGQSIVRDGQIEVDSLSPRDVVGFMQTLPPGGITSLMIPARQLADMPKLSGNDVPNLVVDAGLVPAATLARLRPDVLLAAYDRPAALEEIRTAVVRATPGASVSTRESTFEGYSSDVRTLYRIVATGTIAVSGIAALALLAAVVAGLVERRRALAFLLACGMPLSVLRTSALIEALIPLTALVTLGATIGTLVGHWFDSAATTSRELPGLGLLAPPLLALLVGGGLCAVTVFLVGPVTRAEHTRYE